MLRSWRLREHSSETVLPKLLSSVFPLIYLICSPAALSCTLVSEHGCVAKSTPFFFFFFFTHRSFAILVTVRFDLWQCRRRMRRDSARGLHSASKERETTDGLAKKSDAILKPCASFRRLR